MGFVIGDKHGGQGVENNGEWSREQSVGGDKHGGQARRTNESIVGTLLGRWEREIFKYDKNLGAHSMSLFA